MIRLTLAALALLCAAPAQAMDVYMWGVGPRIGTSFIPGHYPSKFPTAVSRRESNGIEKFRDDFFFGAEGVYYVNRHTRTLLTTNVGLAKRYTDLHLLLKYNYVGQTGAMDFLFGGGLGVGTNRWKGDGDAKLRVPYYPVRVEGSAMIRDETRAYQLGIFAQYNIQSSVTYFDEDGHEIDAKGGIYGYLGLDLTLYFGDFKPPKTRRRPE